MVLRQSAEGRGQKLNVLHSIEKRYRPDARLSGFFILIWKTLLGSAMAVPLDFE